MPKISVIIPLYNKARHIQRSIDSVLSQSFTDFELIVIDDGSTDASAELVRGHYTDKRLRVVSQANAGPGAARNHGLALARAQYVAFLDADDLWLPDFLVSQYRQLTAHPDCAAVLCRYAMDHIDKLWVHDNILHSRRGVWNFEHSDDFETMLHMLSAMTTGNMLWQKTILQKYHGFYENKCTFGEDQYLMINVLLNHKLLINDQPLFVYHIGVSDLTNNRYRQRKAFRPLLLHPETVRQNCPAALRPNLEYYLSWLAFNECCGLIAIHNVMTIIHIRKLYPDMDKIFRWQYFKSYIKLKIKLPLYTLINRLFKLA